MTWRTATLALYRPDGSPAATVIATRTGWNWVAFVPGECVGGDGLPTPEAAQAEAERWLAERGALPQEAPTPGAEPPAPVAGAQPAALTAAELDAIERRAEAAWRGPWAARERGPIAHIVAEEGAAIVAEAGGANAAFIAAARTDVPALVVAVRSAWDERDERAAAAESHLQEAERRGLGWRTAVVERDEAIAGLAVERRWVDRLRSLATRCFDVLDCEDRDAGDERRLLADLRAALGVPDAGR